MPYKIAKFVHVLGFALFFGSLAGHLLFALGPDVMDNPAYAFDARRVSMELARFATLPGVVLMISSGIAMMCLSRLSPVKIGWLRGHVIFAVLTIVVGIGFAGRLSFAALEAALAVIAGHGSVQAFASAQMKSALAVAAVLILAAGTTAWAIIKPRRT